jgi:hypothetical protein
VKIAVKALKRMWELGRPIRVRVANSHRTGQSTRTSIRITKPLGGRTRSGPQLASNFIRAGSCAGMRPGAGALPSR